MQLDSMTSTLDQAVPMPAVAFGMGATRRGHWGQLIKVCQVLNCVVCGYAARYA